MSCKYIEGGGCRHHTFPFLFTLDEKRSSRKDPSFAQLPGELHRHAEITGNADQWICSMNTIWILEFGNQGSGTSL